jgi:hypothetical protein
MQRGSAKCFIVLQPDFLRLRVRFLERDRSSYEHRRERSIAAVLEATGASNSALESFQSEWADIDR